MKNSTIIILCIILGLLILCSCTAQKNNETSNTQTNDSYSDNSICVKNNEDDRIIKNYINIWRAAPSIKNYAWSSGIFITV